MEIAEIAAINTSSLRQRGPPPHAPARAGSKSPALAPPLFASAGQSPL